MITVPTKQHDGASDGASIANFVAGLTPNNVDAFAKYSSNLVRMKALLLLDEDENDDENLDYLGSLNDALRHASAGDHDARSNHGNAPKRRKGKDSYPIKQQGVLQRKTRLSFEIHPNLLLNDLLGLNVSARIPDEEDESKE